MPILSSLPLLWIFAFLAYVWYNRAPAYALRAAQVRLCALVCAQVCVCVCVCASVSGLHRCYQVCVSVCRCVSVSRCAYALRRALRRARSVSGVCARVPAPGGAQWALRAAQVTCVSITCVVCAPMDGVCQCVPVCAPMAARRLCVSPLRVCGPGDHAARRRRINSKRVSARGGTLAYLVRFKALRIDSRNSY